mmetsp:Transcript_34147/g.80369  ORF Transcript_34147/g.80369 Transcript_34147/m.80369 type:complete len:1487 (+) Transcript_34147:190-4650(+)
MRRNFKRRSSSMGSACDGSFDFTTKQQPEACSATREEDLETARQVLSSVLYMKDASGRPFLHSDIRLSWAKALLDRAKNLDERMEYFWESGMNGMDLQKNGRNRKGNNGRRTLMQRRFLLQRDLESGYTPFQSAILERNLDSMLLFLRHAMADDSSTERLTQRPMTLLHAAEASQGQKHANRNKNNRYNNTLLLEMASATDHEGMTPLRLLGRLQQSELSHCRKYLQTFRPSVDRNATMRLRTRHRRSSFDDNDDDDENVDFFSENADLLAGNSEEGRNGIGTDNKSSYACEVVTFGRPHHCALGVVQGAGSLSSAYAPSSSSDKSGQKYSHGSSFCPQRVQEFAQEVVGRPGAAMAAAAATHHTLVVTKKGHLYAFGLEKGGRLGLGEHQPQQCPLPKRVLGALQRRQVVGVAAAENHSLCVTSRGDVYAWGSNRFGQLGDYGTGSSATTPCGSRSLPKRVEELKQYPCVAVAAGEKHSVALTRKGEVYVWGDNTSGQLGVARRSGVQKVQRVEALWGTSGSQGSGNSRPPKIAIAIAAAEQSTLVLTTGSPAATLTNVNAIYGWGHGSHVPIRVHFENYTTGGINNNSANRSSSFASSFSRPPNPTAIACGRFHNAAITSDGLVYTWGLHAESLGRGDNNAKSSKQQHQRRNSSPQLVTGMLSENGGGIAVAIDASGGHTAVVCDDGALFTWGTTDGNNVYNLGHEGVRWQPNPKRVPGVHRAVDVAVAKEHTILLIGTSFPSTPKDDCFPSLELLAAKKATEYVDLFNVIPILIMAERAQSPFLANYCRNFVQRNLDGVLNVGKKSELNQYLNDMLAETTYRGEKKYRDDKHHPFVFDVISAGNVGRPTFDPKWFSDVEDWISGCKKLAESPVVQGILETAAVREYEEDSIGLSSKLRRSSSCQQDYSEFRERSHSIAESASTPIAKECNLGRCMKKAASMNLSTLEHAHENSQWLSKEIRGVRKKLKQIANLLDAETQQVILSPEQKAKVARRFTLEAELNIYETAVGEVEKRIKELSDEKKTKKKPPPSPTETQDDSKIEKGLKADNEPIDQSVTCSVVEEKNKNFFCDVCGVKCTDEANFILHQNGRKHRNRVAQVVEEEKQKTAASIRQQQQIELMKSATAPFLTPPFKNIVKNAWGTPSPQPNYKLPPPPHPVLPQVASTPQKHQAKSSPLESSKMASLSPASSFKKLLKEKGSTKKKVAKATMKNVPSSPSALNFTQILAKHELEKDVISGGTKQPPKPAVWNSNPSSTRCVPLSMYAATDVGFTPEKTKKSKDRSKISLAEFLNPSHEKKAPSSPALAPWTNGPTKKAVKSPPNSKTIAQIQAEEETLKSKQDKTFGTGGGSWYVERRERADSVLEIQKTAQEDLEHRLLVEEQLRIEAQIKEEIERKKRLEDEQKKGGGKRRHKNIPGNKGSKGKPNNAPNVDAKATVASKSNRNKGRSKVSNKPINKPPTKGTNTGSKKPQKLVKNSKSQQVNV